MISLERALSFGIQEVIELILATDMTHHGGILDKFVAVMDGFDFQNTDHVAILKQVLIKACDISNEVRPMEVAGPWVECLLKEYFAQVPVESFVSKSDIAIQYREFEGNPTSKMPDVETINVAQ